MLTYSQTGGRILSLGRRTIQPIGGYQRVGYLIQTIVFKETC